MKAITRTELYLALVGVAVCSAITYGLVAVGFTGDRDPARTGVKLTRSSLSPPTPASRSLPAIPAGPSAAAASPPSMAVIVDNGTVSDQSLLRLAGMVNIANAVNEPPNKAEWQQALPIAENLLTCPCDCAQRNWLRQFVEMGRHALHGSAAEYQQSAQCIVTLGRNNDQAVALSKGGHY